MRISVPFHNIPGCSGAQSFSHLMIGHIENGQLGEKSYLEFGLLLTMIVNCNLWPKWRAWVVNHPGECALWRITGWWAVVDVVRQCHRLGCTLERPCIRPCTAIQMCLETAHEAREPSRFCRIQTGQVWPACWGAASQLETETQGPLQPHLPGSLEDKKMVVR